MRIKLEKRGIRALGISESFRKELWNKSVLGGVIIRSDLVVDGVIFGTSTLGGDDATESIIDMYKRLMRNDINVIILAGAIISRYNIIDIDKVGYETGTPIICVTFKESNGIEEQIKHHFPKKWNKKIEDYRKIGKQEEICLKTGYKIYIRRYGLDLDLAKKTLDKFTLQGSVPEPIRVARILARANIKSVNDK